jgi:hypothetical protein
MTGFNRIAAPDARLKWLQKGSVTAEWLVITLVMIAVFFIPFDGNQSALSLLMDAIRLNYASASHAASLP